jgi:hypothetical protein
LEDRRRFRLLMGHTVFGIHELVPRPCVYITMLRHPAALVPSQYRYVRRTPTHFHHRAVVEGGMSLEDYIDAGLSLEMDNSQTRAVSGDLDTPIGACGPEMLARAKRNLDEWFAVAGITERFDESLVAMGRAFGWRRLHYVRAKRAPRSERGRSVSSATRRLVEERNSLDVELWEHASRRLDALVAGNEARTQLARFRRENALYRPVGMLTYTLPKAVRDRVRALRSRGA